MSKAIQLLKKRLSLEVEQLETHMVLIQQNINKGQRSIDALTDYVQQYSEKLAHMGEQSQATGELSTPITGTELRAHNVFAGQLMVALKAQVKQNDTNRGYLSSASTQLQGMKIRHKTLQNLLDKLEQAANLRQSRMDQKLLDEIANNRYTRG